MSSLTRVPVADVHPVASGASGRRPWRTWVRRVLEAVVAVLAVMAAYDHRSQISDAGRMLSHVRVGWLLVAIGAEVASMVAFARLQHWLLRAGGVRVGLVTMVEITLAGNALSTSLPGGPAWSATWAFEQLRRRGAAKVLAGWVILVAGALSSFAVFVTVAVGTWVAGNRGPVAHLRWVAAVLAAVPVVVGAGYVAARRSDRARRALSAPWQLLSGRLAPARFIGQVVRKTVGSLGLVRPGVWGWGEAFVLALANWLYDCLCLVACLEALGVPVPWRGLLVVYGLTQVAASIPITPGGIGVVEASMTALMIAYGTRSTLALAAVLLYRVVSFWGLVPVGWGAWLGLELAIRGGLRHKAHPWAEHDHGPVPALPAASVAPERVLRPSPCIDCPDGADPPEPDQLARAGTAK